MYKYNYFTLSIIMQPPHSPVVPIEIGPISQFDSSYNYMDQIF